MLSGAGFFIIAAVRNVLEIVTDAAEWDAFLLSQNGHILQSYAWGELKRKFGWRAERVVWREGGMPNGGAQILYRRLAPALTVAYVPRGPVADKENVGAFLAGIKEHARTRGAFLLKLEPDWIRGDEREVALREGGARATTETIQPAATIQIDLTADAETMLARMKPKWRYNIRLAEKKGVVVRAGDTSDFAAFHALMRMTGERDRFAIHGADYYRKAFELWDASGYVRLFVAEYEKQALGMIFVTAFAREAIYLYGASSNAERNRMPNHALHWAAMKWAKERGCARYDLWGIPETAADTGEDANLPSSLYQFKQGFGGETVRYTGAWDFVFDPVKYRVYQYARRMRRGGSF